MKHVWGMVKTMLFLWSFHCRNRGGRAWGYKGRGVRARPRWVGSYDWTNFIFSVITSTIMTIL